MGLEAIITANIDDFKSNLDKAVAYAQDFANKASKKFAELGETLKKIAVPAGAAALAIAAIGLSAVKTFAELEGVKAAFDRLNNPNLLDNLRKATKGTTSDFELMKNAVQASNFKLPVEQLASLMEFASRRAKDTGESVDYLVNSIVTGIGRKSPLILDNLGISATELKKQLNGVSMEAASIADVTETVGRIASAELQKMGKDSDTLTEKFLRIKAIFTNEMGGMGETISKSLRPAIDVVEKLALKFQALSPEMKNTIVYVGGAIAAFAGLLAALGAIVAIAPLVFSSITLMTGGIAAITAAVAVAAIAIINNWESISNTIQMHNIKLLYNLAQFTEALRDLAHQMGLTSYYDTLNKATIALSLSAKNLFTNLSKSKEEIRKKSDAAYADIAASKLMADQQNKLTTSLNGTTEAAERAYINFYKFSALMGLSGKKYDPKKVQDKDLKTLDRGATLDIPLPDIKGIIPQIQADAMALADAFNDKFSEILGSGIGDSISDMASSFGEALSNGGNVIEAMGASLLGSLGSILTQIGKMAIAVGVGIGAVKKALMSLNPVVAIAAGVALVAIGSAFSSGAKNIGSSMGGGNSGYSNSAVKMSDPVNRFRNEPMEISISGEFVQRGNDLVAVVEKNQSRTNRIK